MNLKTKARSILNFGTEILKEKGAWKACYDI
jgi:hypothetical protein